MTTHCSFDLHSPDDMWCWEPFHVPVGHLCVFFGKMSAQVIFPLLIRFVVLLLNCMFSLYILDINPLLDIEFANIFPIL